MPSLSRDPSALLDPKWLKDYQRIKGVLFGEIKTHVETMHLVSRISRFPFRSLYHGKRLPFWITTYHSLYESAVLGVWRLAVDNSNGDFIALGQLKGLMLRYALNERARLDMKQNFEAGDYTRTLEWVDEPVRQHRHQRLAHLKRDLVLGNEKPVEPEELPVAMLEVATDSIKSYYRRLALGSAPKNFLADYQPDRPRSSEHENDIDILLQQLAEKSSWLAYADKGNEHTWEQHAEKIIGWEEEEDFDYYRRQAGFPKLFT